MGERGGEGKVLYLCPGQGAEEPGMGLALAAAFPPAARLLALAAQEVGRDLAALIERGGAALGRCEVVQPALAAVAIGAARALDAAGLAPDLVAGHSAGEVAAWSLAGGVDEADAVRLAALRGRLMADAAARAPGGMAVFRSEHEAVVAALAASVHGQVVLAAENAPDERVLAGDGRALAVALREVPGRPVPGGGPWHTPAMTPAVEPFRAALEAAPLRAPRVALLSGVTGRPAEAGAMPALLAEALVAPVRFERVLATAVSLGVTDVVALGTGRVLASLVRRNGAGTLRVHVAADPQGVARTAETLRAP